MRSLLTTAAIGGGFRQIVRVARYAAVLCASLIITTIAETLNTRDADHVRETQMSNQSETQQVNGTRTLPSVRLTDKRFKYTRACDTDLKETFRKAREAQKAEVQQ